MLLESDHAKAARGLMNAARIILAAAFALGYATDARAIAFSWATVGNAGNPADIIPGPFGLEFYGAVDHPYRISLHEVTNAQYVEFLNSVDPSGANVLELYNASMTTHILGGILHDANAPVGSTYAAKSGRGQNPVNFVSLLDAMRFVNWLDNGQASGGTEDGVYAVADGSSEVRAPGSTFFLPTDDEWYKAAFHQNDGATGNYWDYPTGTDVAPTDSDPPGTLAADPSNTGNFFDEQYLQGYGPDDQSQNWLTDVGAYALATSPYGTFDQAGNVSEWTESRAASQFPSGGLPIVRGTRWNDLAGGSDVTRWEGVAPDVEASTLGFRIAMTPEPPAMVLGCFVAIGLLAVARGRRVNRGKADA